MNECVKLSFVKKVSFFGISCFHQSKIVLDLTRSVNVLRAGHLQFRIKGEIKNRNLKALASP